MRENWTTLCTTAGDATKPEALDGGGWPAETPTCMMRGGFMRLSETILAECCAVERAGKQSHPILEAKEAEEEQQGEVRLPG